MSECSGKPPGSWNVSFSGSILISPDDKYRGDKIKLFVSFIMLFATIVKKVKSQTCFFIIPLLSMDWHNRLPNFQNFIRLPSEVKRKFMVS